MDMHQLPEKSEETFYFAAYSRFRQRELYEKHFKIIKVISGTSILSGNDMQITLHAGEYAFVNRGGFSRIRMLPEKNRPYKMLCINFTDKFLENYVKQTIRPAVFGPKIGAFEALQPNVALDAFFASLSVYALNNLYPGKKLLDLKLQECAHVLSLYYPHLLTEMCRNQSADERLSLEAFMNANYMYNAPLERFAELSGRSLSTFRREFEQLFHTTPAKWLIQKRLEAAYVKIAQEGCRPSEIYWELGFETLAHFSRKFKEQYHIAPSTLYKAADSST